LGDWTPFILSIIGALLYFGTTNNT
jgi:hypothetical protein